MNQYMFVENKKKSKVVIPDSQNAEEGEIDGAPTQGAQGN
jgi:hypothetical protein